MNEQQRKELDRLLAPLHAKRPLIDFVERLIAEERERCAKVCETRAERRFDEYGYVEPDTNATYYNGVDADEYQTRDEEDEDCAKAIRARGTVQAEVKEG